MSEYITSSVTPINPAQIFNDGFELSDQAIIPSTDFTGSFLQGRDIVEFHIYDANVNHLYSDYKFDGWSIGNQNTDTTEQGATDTLTLTPDSDILKAGYQNGTLYAVYNFINTELNSNSENRYFISQISSDRTEIELKSNFIESPETAASFVSLKERIDNADYFDEFYLSFGNNEYVIGVNVELQEGEEELSILVKLYDALPLEYQLKDEVYLATKVGETQSYKVDFVEDFSSLLNNANYIKGPNVNIELKDLVNNSTELKSKADLLDTNSSTSLNNVIEALNQKGVTITPNYSYNNFHEFVNFSSAKERINNFIEKVKTIEGYQTDINTIAATTGSNPSVPEISASIASLVTNIQNIIKNFDGFESYQYKTDSIFAYPKEPGDYPYTLKSTTDTDVLEWLGSDDESNQYYGGYVLSASLFDENNQNWLYYTIPEFIRENDDNNQYTEFSNMVGQHFDEIWLYTKAVSERYNTTNDPDTGLPLGLAEEAIKGLGFPSFGNNFNNQDNFIGLTGEDGTLYVPPTGSELINHYIAVNQFGDVLNYWEEGYGQYLYTEEEEDAGFPYSIDKVSKEIFKRLYHNMAYLTKKKGTISGLRQLINIWGIPNTILRINEFGGKNKDNSDDYDYWFNRYGLAFHPIANQNVASASIRVPWMPLERNNIADSEYIVPDGFAFRFKTTGIPSSSYAGGFYSQSLASKKSNGADNDSRMDFAVMLNYSPKTSGSYSGSISEDERYGELTFQLKGDVSEGSHISSTAISLPFFDEGWWSVLVQRDQHVSASDDSNNTTYTIYAKNKQYNGYDGNYIGWEGSASFTIDASTSSSYNGSWNAYNTSSADGLYLGGYISGSRLYTNVDIQPAGRIFSGSLQELRYYSNPIEETVFNDFVMNPRSVEGNSITGSESSFDIVAFRAPLGNELEYTFTSSDSSSFTFNLESYHPATSGSSNSIITSSFVNPVGNVTSSTFDFIVYGNEIGPKTYSIPNREVDFMDQPAVGVRNRISNKIQIEDGDAYGTTLSRVTSIDQNYQISRSYTEDITSLEVAFSPQDQINDDIINAFGYGVVSDALADPRHLSSSDSYYPRLRSISEEYFKKYTKGNIYDYLRLIKYFDNSIFKAIKSYVPARTSVTTGIVVKQHLLERNRRPPVTLDPITKIAVNSSGGFNDNIEVRNLEITSSIQVGSFSGGNAGVPPNLEGNVSSSKAGMNIVPVTQSWSGSYFSQEGDVLFIDESQKEFFDGEYSGSTFPATTQSLFDNPYANQSFEDIPYDVEVTYEKYARAMPGSGGPYRIRLFYNQATGEYPRVTPDDLNTIFSVDNNELLKIFISKDTNNPQILKIAAIAFNKDYWPHIDTDLGIYPSSSAGMDTGQGGSWTYHTGSVGVPNFFLTIPDPDIGTIGKTSTEWFNEPSNLVWSVGLNPAQDGAARGTTIDGNPWFRFDMADNTQYVRSRPIEGLGDPSWNVVGFGQFDGQDITITDQTDFQYLSLKGAQENWEQQQVTITPGELGVHLLPLTYITLGAGGNNVSSSIVASICAHNEDKNGRDNRNTLVNPSVDFNFTLPVPTGAPEWTQNNVSSNLVRNTDSLVQSFKTTGSKVIFQYEGDGTSDFSRQLSHLDTQDPTSINITPLLPSNFNFDNSDFNAILNNVTGSRLNSKIEILDFGDGIETPSNLDKVRTGTALKADTPDSNYTQKSRIIPRYEGSKLESVDYNNYTPSSSVTASNGDVIYWDGDKSYGKEAVISKNPIYFAHFKKSYHNPQFSNTFTFEVDSLIVSPQDAVVGTNPTPETIQIDGSNNELFSVKSTFEVDRKALIAYNSSNFTGPDGSSIDFSNLKVGENKIFQGGLELQPLLASTMNQYGSSSGENVYPNFSPTLSFNRGDWIIDLTSSNANTQADFTSSVVDTNEIYVPVSEKNETTGYLVRQNSTQLLLVGGIAEARVGYHPDQPEASGSVQGPGLGLLHSLNVAVSMSTPFSESSATTYQLGVPTFDDVVKVDPNLNLNYFRWNAVDSNLEGYPELDIPFIIKVGDEVDITYLISGSTLTNPVYETTTHIVTKIDGSVQIGGTIADYSGSVQGIEDDRRLDGNSLYNRLTVSPTMPSFEEEQVNRFTIRRRVNADDRVIIYQTPPRNAYGINQSSEGGFIIPGDFTAQQKRNALTLINQLRSQNAFTQDNSTS